MKFEITTRKLIEMFNFTFATFISIASIIFFLDLFGLIILSNKDILLLYSPYLMESVLFLFGYFAVSTILGLSIGFKWFDWMTNERQRNNYKRR